MSSIFASITDLTGLAPAPAAVPTSTGLAPPPAKPEPDPDPDCPICADRFDGKKRSKVQCGYCSAVACGECVRTFLLGRLGDPLCMSCNHGWSRDFLDSSLTKAWMLGAYKQHREKVLLDREIAQLPATQEAVPQYREYRRIQSERKADEEKVKKANALYKQMQLRFGSNSPEADRAQADFLMKRADLGDKTRRCRQLDHRRFMPTPAVAPAAGATTSAEPVDPGPKFVRACPVTGCRGFLSSGWKCGTCETRVCPKCHDELPTGEKKKADHECDPDKVATAELLAKDTKPCPKCASLIHKIGGCDQMWCVQCRVAFSWRTGRIEKGAVHNPHYFQWRAEHRGVAVADVHADGIECGVVDYVDFRTVYRGRKTISGKLNAFHQLKRHVHNIADLMEAEQQRQEDNHMLRLRYLVGELTRDAFADKLQRKEKLRSKGVEQNQVYRMFIEASMDLLRKVIVERDDDYVHTVLGEFMELVRFADEAIDGISKRYNMKCSTIKTLAKETGVDKWIKF